MVVELDERDITKANSDAFKIGQEKFHENNPLLLEESASVGFAITKLEKAVSLGIKKGENVGIFVTGMGMYNPNNPPQWMLDVSIR